MTLSQSALACLGGCEIQLGWLSGIGDRICLRDPRGLSLRPALRRSASGVLQVEGPFSILQRFSVDPGEGAAFALSSRDQNPLHTEGDIVPGAMIAARALLLPETLLSDARVRRARLKFRSPARYGLPTVNLYHVGLAEGGALRLEVQVRQEGMEVVQGQVVMAVDPPRSSVFPRRNSPLDPPEGTRHSPLDPVSSPPPPPEGASEGTSDAFPPSVPRRGDGAFPPRTSPEEEMARVRAFLWSLRIDPVLYFERAGLVYPRAYLAALPSGEMVRQFSGEGGLLNGLDLEFPGEASLGADTLPTVELEGARRSRKTFHKILARIVEGVRTCCSGFAMVLPAFPSRSAVPDALPAVPFSQFQPPRGCGPPRG